MVGATGFEPAASWPPAWWGLVRRLSPDAVCRALPRHFRPNLARSSRRVSPTVAEMAVHMAVRAGPAGPQLRSTARLGNSSRRGQRVDAQPLVVPTNALGHGTRADVRSVYGRRPPATPKRHRRRRGPLPKRRQGRLTGATRSRLACGQCAPPASVRGLALTTLSHRARLALTSIPTARITWRGRRRTRHAHPRSMPSAADEPGSHYNGGQHSGAAGGEPPAAEGMR
jgi:hypothetical protein